MRYVKHKFKAKSCESDGIKFGSKKERAYYERLKLLQKSGEILFFLRQVPFDLPGKVRYFCDFLEFHADGNCVFTEVKGYMTDLGLMKLKVVQDLYNIDINIV